MDVATMKQKAYIKDLFVQFGVPKWVFNPMVAWNISKKDASSLINDLQVLKKSHHGDLKEMICQTLEGKKILKETTKTIDELEEAEEHAACDPTSEDWLDKLLSNEIDLKTFKTGLDVLLPRKHKGDDIGYA